MGWMCDALLVGHKCALNGRLVGGGGGPVNAHNHTL